jgi:type IV pilus assembly protein PilW
MTLRMPLGKPLPARHLQQGVNLIEIMVSMAIGLFLVLGATTLYINTKRTSDVDDSIARLQETARYALSIIETDVRMANYWGLTKDGSAIRGKESENNPADRSSALATGTADDCGAAFNDPEVYLEATNNRYALDCPAAGNAVESADVLVVRRVATADVAADNSRLQICSTRQEGRLTRGAHAECATNAEYHNLIVHGYYVDQESAQDSNYPALRRWTLVGGPDYTPVEIIPGVEDMQIEIGWDDSEDRKTAAEITRYVQPEDALLTNAGGFPSGRIAAVRVWLLIRAETPDATFTDDRTYVYGDRAVANGVVSDINDAAAAGAAYAPNDNFRRLLVSRTIYVRNVPGNN